MLKCLPLQYSTTMFISKVVVVFSALLVSSVIAAPVITERSLDEVELLPRAGLGFKGAAAAIASKIRSSLKPKPGGAVFWSGKVPGTGKKEGKDVSVKQYADKFAKNKGKETIGGAMKRADIKIPNQSKHNWNLWKTASKFFAHRASGDTHAVLGSKRQQGNIYDTIEKPTLMKNPKVTKLTEHHVASGSSTVVKDTSKSKRK